MNKRILLVEDEEALASVVRLGLEAAQFEVDVAADGLSGLQQALEHKYAAILLDVLLPRLDGREVCRRIRQHGHQTPILMLTAMDAEADRVGGLEAGADDYLGKPFEFQELLARVRALVRRSTVYRTGMINAGDIEIDLVARRVRRGHADIPMSDREFALMAALATRQGQVLTREFILDLVWHDGQRHASLLEAYIHKLRRKLAAVNRPELIQTIPGMGYVLTGTSRHSAP